MSWLREPDAEPIPGYRLVEPLGTGGFGEVWKCIAPGGIFKAIKFVYGNLNSLDGDSLRAEQELKALLRVKEVRHPFVLSTERIDIVGGEVAIVMELADKSLHDLFVDYQGQGLPGIPRDELMLYLRDAADGLDHLIDKHNLQHLDVKPRNLFLIADRVKVADFGLVKQLERQSSSGMLGGVTPIYASPETFSGKISKHSDQYSLAVVYIELMSGQKPFNGKNIRQLAIQHMTEPPDLTMLPEADRPIVERALAKDPARRFPNCLAFVRALYSGRLPAESEAGSEATARPLSRVSFEDLLLEPPADAPDHRRPAAVPNLTNPTDALLRETPRPLRPVRSKADRESESGLSHTVIQLEPGVLRPTILVGIGSFGRRVLLEMRCRLIDRFGDLSQVPLFRFLYVDSDPEAPKKAAYAVPEVALDGGQVFLLPLQPPANYRRRMLEHLNDWLPREKLYTIPRSLQPQGSRALARLAFSDNFLRFVTRLRREVQVATHPESLAQSLSQTGLALRDNCPRVLVFASAGGASGGMLPDLGYALQQVLEQMHHPKAPVTAFLHCGAPQDPATPSHESANVYATLTELNHFSDPNVNFASQYGPDGPKLFGEGGPFHAIYLLQTEHRSPESLRHCFAHLGSYLAHDLTTPLGSRLDKGRQQPHDPLRTPFRSFGTYSVWFPRGLLLRAAARQACQTLLLDWAAAGEPTAPRDVDAICTHALSDAGLRWEMLGRSIENSAQTPADGSPTEALGRMIGRLEEQFQHAAGLPDPGPWARTAMDHVREWVGLRTSTDPDSLFRSSRLCRALSQGVQQLAEQWERRLLGQALHLTEYPGRRLANAEAALRQMVLFFADAADAQRERAREEGQRSEQARADLQAALEACQVGTGGFSLFGNRTARALRHFMEQLTAFTRRRLSEDLLEAGVQFFRKLQGRLEERLRDLSFCRQRLTHLRQALNAPVENYVQITAMARHAADPVQSPSPIPLSDPFQDAVQGTPTLQVVLPEGETDLDRAAGQFLRLVRPEHYHRLDQVLQALVLSPLGGVYDLCQKNSDLVRYLGNPLIDQATAFLGELMPVTDVAQVEFSTARAGADVPGNIRGYYKAAAPLVSGDSGQQRAFLLIPATESGERFGEEAASQFPDVQLLRESNTQGDVMFCREQGPLSAPEMAGLLGACRRAYQQLAVAPLTSPHSRFDIIEWVPLDPG